MLIRTSFLFITIYFVCSFACPAQSAQTPTGTVATGAAGVNGAPAAVAPRSPTVDQVLDGYVKAIGGRAAYEKLTSRVAKGTLEISAIGTTGTVELYAKPPNNLVLIANIPNFGVLQEGFNSTTGWSMDPINGLREKTGAELASAKIDADFYRDLKLGQLYGSAKLLGVEKVGGREAYLVEFASPEGGKQKFDFEIRTGLLIRTSAEHESSAGKLPIEIIFEDYRDVDGVKVPFTVRQNSPTATVVIKFDEIKHNVPIDATKFNKPSAP